ncbi:MAG: YIP1 family protein, partial [Halobacteriaceae archaeon]
MTTWLRAEGGRARGPRAIWNAWIAILIKPSEFFERGITPGDQAPGLIFAMVTSAVAALFHLLTFPAYALVFGDRPALSMLLVFAFIVLFITPISLHVVAAVETLGLIGLVPNRNGISETVQVIGYSTAPCALAGLPSPTLRVVVTAWGVALLMYGTMVVHDADPLRSSVASLLPSMLVFGFGF